MNNFQTKARCTASEFAEAVLGQATLPKIFQGPDGWHAECAAGLLYDCGTDTFAGVEPLAARLVDLGITRMVLEP
jgi:hypothetical protein